MLSFSKTCREEVLVVGKQNENIQYEKPVMKTVITPTEIRDIEQPCAFYLPGEKRPSKK